MLNQAFRSQGREKMHNTSTATKLDVSRPKCSGCTLSRRCLPGNLSEEQTARFESAVVRCRQLAAGDHLFRVGDPFRWMFAVHTGCFKTYAVDSEGREHVLSFHFASEIIGVDAIYPERHVSNSVALVDSTVCYLPFPAVTRLAHDMPELQSQLFRVLSRDLLSMTSMAGDFTAEERLAAFLVMVAARLRVRGPSPTQLELAMSRQDIANYLRLAPETVSRILARFQKSGLVKADRKHITLTDPDGLMDIAACMNPYARYGNQQPMRANLA
jgi:CRP/FNR family transcriptional regulator